MPSLEELGRGSTVTTSTTTYEPHGGSHEKQGPSSTIYPYTGSKANGISVESVNINHKGMNGIVLNGESAQQTSNGRQSDTRERHSKEESAPSTSNDHEMETERKTTGIESSRKVAVGDGLSAMDPPNGEALRPMDGKALGSSKGMNGDAGPLSNRSKPPTTSNMLPSSPTPYLSPSSVIAESGSLDRPRSPSAPQRYSSPPTLPTPGAANATSSGTSSTPHPGSTQLRHRHTLQVPKLAAFRAPRDLNTTNPNVTEDPAYTSGRFSPTNTGTRRASLSLGRRVTRSIHSDMHLDEVPQDEDAARWAEVIRQKRASKRKRKEEEDDDRVVVGIKVDQNHVNWVTAYNMLTGIRFCVSRTNAKIDRSLTDSDFDAKHKFSFDITGNELTPSAKYDFKFKDYAPWVFRHLRTRFNLDPADYLMSLTSKYILSELGSPGKSGSFFYFSRDYKYIIKTIHHAEHKFLRKILRDYYRHVEDNPNTLLSQFYGLHRVKIPYGRKIHFVVMNNLFPPHRDIHQTFDLKGSTIGRDFKEEDLERNPRATLKDLNWLRRNLHLEFGPNKKQIFLQQVERDVKLLQELKIMDYSLLVGIHDLEKGNDENLRDKTLRIFQPGGERPEEPQQNMLMRTPSKLETARKARELREIIKKEKPIPMDRATSKMPDQMLEERKHFTFYGDDGGFQASHEDDRPGEETYYLGIIDCLTHYGFIKKAEHFWKGLSNPKSQISPIPPEGYGDRFVKFIRGITKTREEIEREPSHTGPSLETQRNSAHLARNPTEKVMEKAERQARKSERHGANEANAPDRTMSTVRSSSVERSGGGAGATLPVVEEAGEAGSTSGRSGRSRGDSDHHEKISDGGLAMSPPRIGSLDVDNDGRIDGIGVLEIGAAR